MAEPELNGFGVTTSMPGFRRSSQVLMFLGLPLRATIVTTEPKGMPLCSFAFQSLSTSPASTRRVTSGSTEKLTTSVGRPDSTLRDWSPDGPYDWLKETPLPAAVFWNSGITLSKPTFGTA